MAPGDQSPPAVQEDHLEQRSPGVAPRPREIVSRYCGGFVFLGLLALALAVYLPYALEGGWYYDDWALYATFDRAGESWASQFSSCTSSIPAGRKLTCLYHVTEFHLFGNDRAAYHLTAIAFLVAMATLAYAILRRCRLPWQWAAVIAALVILFPSSDSTRLWPTGAIGQYVIVIELTGVLLVLIALERRRRAAAIALHALGTVLFVVAMLTYEITIPLVALNGLVYWAARRDRAALWRGAADFALAACFVLYRLIVEPPDPAGGFTVDRTPAETLNRALDLVNAAWRTWHETFLPGTLGTIGVIGVIALSTLLFATQPRMRHRLLPWLALLGASLAVAGAATFVFLTANDIYLPQVHSVFNRVTLPATIAYVGIFIALVGLGYEILRRFVSVPYAAAVSAAVVVLASGYHQLRVSTDHKRAWEASWVEQQIALDGYATATRKLSDQSRVLGTGAPIWEVGFVPIFAATWDLGNALDYTTPFEPSEALPLQANMFCGRRGIVADGVLLTPYRVPEWPLYLIDATRRAARPVDSQASCQRAIAAWGRPPLFAPTVRD